MSIKRIALIILGCGGLAVTLTACGSHSAATLLVTSEANGSSTESVTAIAATATINPTVVSPGSATSMLRPTPAPDAWKSYPSIPTFSDRAKEIFRRGLALGRNPHVFSKIGDGRNITTYFLADYEKPEKYRRGPYQDLQATIECSRGRSAARVWLYEAE